LKKLEFIEWIAEEAVLDLVEEIEIEELEDGDGVG
jgi:hypothetical protein